MQINWKVRAKNKTWIMSFLLLCITFIYNALGMFGIVPPISEELVVELVVAVINILVALGVIVDPTTKGMADSERAMSYEKPN